jgi:hypothetical protein
MDQVTQLLGSNECTGNALNNLAYVIRGEDLVEPPKWSKSSAPRKLEWLHVIETQEQAEFSS